MQTLSLALIGNGRISALVDQQGQYVWCCVPRVDAPPLFDALLAGHDDRGPAGRWSVTLVDQVRTEQHYCGQSAVLQTRLYSRDGSIADVVDWAPVVTGPAVLRQPLELRRRIVPRAGIPRVRMRMSLRASWGTEPLSARPAESGLHFAHPRGAISLRSSPLPAESLSAEEVALHQAWDLRLAMDDGTGSSACTSAEQSLHDTRHFWRQYVQSLTVPDEWADAVIRSAITLKQCQDADTGAIVAAITTSLPESPDSGRTWDYRYCWLRDARYGTDALCAVGDQTAGDRYAHWATAVVSSSPLPLQPVYGVGGERLLDERQVPTMRGYRTMGPVREGNQAAIQQQHDVYGSVILALTNGDGTRRIADHADVVSRRRLAALGEEAWLRHGLPDAGFWEFRTREAIHTSSAAMCWAACDRLAAVSHRDGDHSAARLWRRRSASIRARIEREAWSERRQAYVGQFGGESLDASVLLMNELGCFGVGDPRLASTVAAIERTLCAGALVRRYEAADDFGVPSAAFLLCAFWRVDALARLGHHERARELFQALLEYRNHAGLLSEGVLPSSGELWGNFPQVYSMSALILTAVRLSLASSSLSPARAR